MVKVDLVVGCGNHGAGRAGRHRGTVERQSSSMKNEVKPAMTKTTVALTLGLAEGSMFEKLCPDTER